MTGPGWTRGYDLPAGACPPDFTMNRFSLMCKARHHEGYVCTRRDGHTGRHAAGDGDMIVAVWS